jgi:MoaA/NifB/PqqE/SkfB family radical SAM enzyme
MQTGLETKATLLLLLECNARCPFCSIPMVMEEGVAPPTMPETGSTLPVLRSAREHKRTLAEVKSEYDSLYAQGVRRVNLGGGEPTTWPDLPGILEYGHQIGLEEQLVNSNGMRFRNAAYARQVVAARPSSIILSLFGARPETHDASFRVPGLFNDVTLAVENLLAATAEQPAAGRTQIVAQFTMHRWNHAELPEMFRYWYAKGLRQFSIKLLRDSPATARHTKEESWFFDLEELRAPLQESLDWANFKPDVAISMAEVLYCLLSPSYFGFVLADLGSNPNLLSTDLRVSRLAPTTPIERFDTIQVKSECHRCDVESVCMQLRTCHLELFTGKYEAIHVAPRIEALASRPLSREEALRLRPLLKLTPVLDQAGVPEEQRAVLRRAYQDALKERPDLLAIELFQAREQERLQAYLNAEPAKPLSYTIVSLGEVGGSGSLRGDHRAVLGRLRAQAPAQAAAKLQFLAERTNYVVSTEHLMAFAYEKKDAAGVATRVLAILLDEAKVDADAALRAIDPMVEAAATARPSSTSSVG